MLPREASISAQLIEICDCLRNMTERIVCMVSAICAEWRSALLS
jgi:hypothetical protein